MRMRRNFAKGLLIAFILTLLPVMAFSAQKISAGSACKIYKQKLIYQNKTFTCLKLGKHLYWSNGIKAPAPLPKTTPIAKAVPCSSGGECNLGVVGPGGGIVFYDAGSKQAWGRYLEYAPNGWSGNSIDPWAQWCDSTKLSLTSVISNASLKASLGVGIGQGAANSLLMLAGCKTGAAELAASYKGGNQSDWHLPSSVELNELCKFVHNQIPGKLNESCGGGSGLIDGFMPSRYWSSSEALRFTSFGADFKSGISDLYFKTESGYVRPVRAFSSSTLQVPPSNNPFLEIFAKIEREKCATTGECPVGSIGPGGGIVFYDAGSVQSWGRYLEMAPNGWANAPDDITSKWCDISNIDFLASVLDQNLRNRLGREIGNGRANSELMLSKCSEGAANLAMGYRGGGKSDWYLPSFKELNEICKFARFQPTGNPNVQCAGMGPFRVGFIGTWYWSSSEGAGGSSSMVQNFGTGLQVQTGKQNSVCLRPIRSF